MARVHTGRVPTGRLHTVVEVPAVHRRIWVPVGRGTVVVEETASMVGTVAGMLEEELLLVLLVVVVLPGDRA